jgi:hypothetical protein
MVMQMRTAQSKIVVPPEVGLVWFNEVLFSSKTNTSTLISIFINTLRIHTKKYNFYIDIAQYIIFHITYYDTLSSFIRYSLHMFLKELVSFIFLISVGKSLYN